MKIIIFSDSHGYTDKMSDVLYTINCDLVIHLGDYVRDGEKLRTEHSDLNICIIPGNNDFAFNESKENNEKILELEGKKILACHGHKYNVKNGLDRLISIAGQRQFNIVLFGHTHIAYNKIIDGIHFINPGSVTQNGTYAILNIDKKTFSAEIKNI